MKDTEKRERWTGPALLSAFAVSSVMIRKIDVQNVGPDGTAAGFSSFNMRFHQMTENRDQAIGRAEKFTRLSLILVQYAHAGKTAEKNKQISLSDPPASS